MSKDNNFETDTAFVVDEDTGDALGVHWILRFDEREVVRARIQIDLAPA